MSIEYRTRFAASLTALLFVAAPAAAWTGHEVARPAAEPAMPAMLYLAVARGQAADVAAAYRVDRTGHGANPRHRLELAFTARGARFDGPAGGFTLHLERFGRGDGRPVHRAAPRVDGAWVEYDRGLGLTEWFVNLPRGVEQGWTVARRPAGSGALVLELDTARPPEESDDRRLAWSGLVYHRLAALDADGRELPALWTHDGGRLRIEVDDREAAYPVLIDPWVEQAKLTADDGARGDGFGSSVALAGDSALVGAPAALGGNGSQGAAYVFTRSDGVWSQQAKLTADDGVADDTFGRSVALTGDSALVGAYGADVGGNSSQGAAYVFTHSDGVWSQQAKLTADDGATDDQFGVSVALAGDSALVGASLAETDGNALQGAAYVFTRSGAEWNQQAKLTADDGAAGDTFGWSVALMGDSALVGAFQADVGGNSDQGAAYVFTRSDGVWSPQAKLTANEGAMGDGFGISVALADDSALVGAFLVDVGSNTNQGAAYVFTRDDGAWSQQTQLTADDGAAYDWFGVSVALAGDAALVGATIPAVDRDTGQGAAYVFTRSSGVWSQHAELTANDGAEGDSLGFSVDLAGDSALVGAFGADVGGNSGQGAAYVFLPPLVPAALEVDAVPLAFDGNRVFEPGEQVELAPSWRNDGDVPLTVSGNASSFTGPTGAIYDLVLANADYGTLAPGAVSSCRDTGVCYALEVDDPAVRPALHWDATVQETVPEAPPKTWTLHIGNSFADVPRTNAFYPFVETLLHHRITLGCGGEQYCPSAATTRAQAAALLLRSREGSDFTPPLCSAGQEVFADVPFDDPFCPWIEELSNRGITAGCATGTYCPSAPVTRAQMAALTLATAEGPGFTPPPCAQGDEVFADVPFDNSFCPWIEELVARGISAGCGAGNYCPAQPTPRGQLSAFLARTFDLSLYGP